MDPDTMLFWHVVRNVVELTAMIAIIMVVAMFCLSRLGFAAVWLCAWVLQSARGLWKTR